MPVTPAYAAVAALLFIVLSFRTIGLRRKLLIGVGSGESKELLRAMRVHANFAEYVPLALLLIYFLELQSDSNTWIHVLCIGLLIGRVLHAFGVSQVREKLYLRQAGMVLTFIAILAASVQILMAYI